MSEAEASPEAGYSGDQLGNNPNHVPDETPHNEEEMLYGVELEMWPYIYFLMALAVFLLLFMCCTKILTTYKCALCANCEEDEEDEERGLTSLIAQHSAGPVTKQKPRTKLRIKQRIRALRGRERKREKLDTFENSYVHANTHIRDDSSDSSSSSSYMLDNLCGFAHSNRPVTHTNALFETTALDSSFSNRTDVADDIFANPYADGILKTADTPNVPGELRVKSKSSVGPNGLTKPRPERPKTLDFSKLVPSISSSGLYRAPLVELGPSVEALNGSPVREAPVESSLVEVAPMDQPLQQKLAPMNSAPVKPSHVEQLRDMTRTKPFHVNTMMVQVTPVISVPPENTESEELTSLENVGLMDLVPHSKLAPVKSAPVKLAPVQSAVAEIDLNKKLAASNSAHTNLSRVNASLEGSASSMTHDKLAPANSAPVNLDLLNLAPVQLRNVKSTSFDVTEHEKLASMNSAPVKCVSHIKLAPASSDPVNHSHMDSQSCAGESTTHEQLLCEESEESDYVTLEPDKVVPGKVATSKLSVRLKLPPPPVKVPPIVRTSRNKKDWGRQDST